jgi:trimeric autotransporter adhesin
MNKILASLLLFTFFIATKTVAQSVSINADSTAADSSAILDIKSAKKGILVPRLTKAQKDSIAMPAVGLLVFQTDSDKGFYYYNGSSWLLLLAVSVSSNNNTLTYTTRGF